MVSRTVRGWIWDVRGFALHDGPGIRTTVFFKGCPLSCAWCCNPETQAPGAELACDAARCVDCRWCVGVCPTHAVADLPPNARVIDRSACTLCGECVDRCAGGALTLPGELVSVSDLLSRIGREAAFHARSGGGLTLSGGEPLWQAEFAGELVRRYKRDAFGSSVTIETSGAVPWEAFEAVRSHTDLFLFDIKHPDPVEHKRLTGADNRAILENLEHLVHAGQAVIMRLPLVPGCNDSDETLRSVGQLARSIGVREIHVLPYHRLGERRYAGLGRDYPLAGTPALTPERAEQARDLLIAMGLTVSIGGS